VSVDTYIGRRNTSSYQVVQQDGVEILISNSLAPYIANIELDCKRIIFMNRLKAKLELNNGAVVMA
jgi:hypothetical protein